MIYTQLTKKAMRIAYDAHHGQMDKSGVPYIFHPIHLAEQMLDEDTTVAALLHDVVEDTEITPDELAAQGFPPQIIEALDLLTHDEGVDYMGYVRRIAANPIAKAVKMADLNHNRDMTRLDEIDDRARRWEEKYSNATRILEGIAIDS